MFLNGIVLIFKDSVQEISVHNWNYIDLISTVYSRYLFLIPVSHLNYIDIINTLYRRYLFITEIVLICLTLCTVEIHFLPTF